MFIQTERLKESIVASAEELRRLHARIHETVKLRNRTDEGLREWQAACEVFHTRYDQLAFPGGYPALGDRDIATIQPSDMLAVVRAVEARDALDVAARVIQRSANVFRYGILTGRCTTNPASELRGVIKQRKVKHRAALSLSDLPEFLEKLKNYDGRPETRLGLQLLMLTFVRTGELRGASWSEIDFDREELRIPAERKKMKEEHVVPLARQTISALRELQKYTSWSELLFPGTSDGTKPISENTLLYALYRMGYHGRATGHGFRALASTCLNEMGWNPDVIERQLAHAERNKVRAAYNRASYLVERRKMMQAWADFIDAQRIGKVVPLKKTEPMVISQRQSMNQ